LSGHLQPIVPLGGEVETGKVAGEIGRLLTVDIDKLYVDGTYQRAVSVGSVKNIRRICARFDWAKFLPVIVTEDGDRFSIVDGQHRTIAAATIGIRAVPCYVLSCSPAEAAAAFAAINGNVTPMQPIDIWFAELAAKDPGAVALQAVLDAAGVTITRKKEGFAVGETRSISVMRRAYDFYGPAILTTILQCIVETSGGNPGMLYGAMINGIGRALRTKPDLLANPSRLFEIFDEITLSELAYDAGVESAKTGNPVQFIITRMINAEVKRADDHGGLRRVA
jgi:hypothetical protein